MAPQRKKFSSQADPSLLQSLREIAQAVWLEETLIWQPVLTGALCHPLLSAFAAAGLPPGR